MSGQWDNARLMIIGDAMVDRYIWGQVNRISPEAPVPVLNWSSDENRLGGAANVALNARALNIPVALCSMRGMDDNGQLLTKLCEKESINSAYIYSSNNRPTSVKTRILAGQQHLLRVDRESSILISDKEVRAIQQLWKRALDEFQPNIIIMQDYNKGLLHPKLIKWLIESARALGIFIAVDPKKQYIQHFKKVHLFKPNLKELSEFLQRPVLPELASLRNAGKELQEILNFDHLLVTLSEHGIYYQDQQGNSGIAPTRPRPIVDVCGAGDAVITLAALAVRAGYNLEETASLCNIAGGQVCGSVGVSTLDREAILKEWNA